MHESFSHHTVSKRFEFGWLTQSSPVCEHCVVCGGTAGVHQFLFLLDPTSVWAFSMQPRHAQLHQCQKTASRGQCRQALSNTHSAQCCHIHRLTQHWPLLPKLIYQKPKSLCRPLPIMPLNSYVTRREWQLWESSRQVMWNNRPQNKQSSFIVCVWVQKRSQKQSQKQKKPSQTHRNALNPNAWVLMIGEDHVNVALMPS